MNLYIIVEGKETEPIVYTAWLKILAPRMAKVENAWDVVENNYYLFSSQGIPSIYKHVANAIVDINNINAGNKGKYDYLLVCLDTEEETREYIEEQISKAVKENGEELKDVQLLVFEQKVCMETWFLGNRKVFKANAQDEVLLSYISEYNVRDLNPEDMNNLRPENYSTKAKFHQDYLKRMFRERNMRYSKSKPDEVCKKQFLEQLISRYHDTNDIKTFGSWYEFIKNNPV